jgi:hypothetical protein
MPVSWEISHGVVRLLSDDTASFDEWRKAFEAALGHPDHRAGMGVVHDWRRLPMPPSAEEVRKRVRYVSRLGPRRWALVVPDEVGYGMGRMAEILTDELSIRLRVFRDMGEAEAWARGERE